MVGLLIAVLIALYIVLLVPAQYGYISEMKEIIKRKGQEDYYKDMSFEEEQLHYNAQGNLIILPATLIANFIYKLKHKNAKC